MGRQGWSNRHGARPRDRPVWRVICSAIPLLLVVTSTSHPPLAMLLTEQLINLRMVQQFRRI
jgi:hypothetical protein